MTDDPHDETRLPFDRHGACLRCGEPYEECECDRLVPPGGGIAIAVGFSLFIMFIVGIGMWLL